jgi:hypothetical protein
MMQAALGRWQVSGTHVHLVMVLWWLNRQLDLITWRLRLTGIMVGLLAAAGSIASERKRKCV